MDQSSYPYYDQYEEFFKQTFICIYCNKSIVRGESIGRSTYTPKETENISKSTCWHHSGTPKPLDKHYSRIYMSCCDNEPDTKGCKPCDHIDLVPNDQFIDIPAFCIQKGWVKPLKSNEVSSTKVFLEGKNDKEKKLNIFDTIYKIKRFEI